MFFQQRRKRYEEQIIALLQEKGETSGFQINKITGIQLSIMRIILNDMEEDKRIISRWGAATVERGWYKQRLYSITPVEKDVSLVYVEVLDIAHMSLGKANVEGVSWLVSVNENNNLSFRNVAPLSITMTVIGKPAYAVVKGATHVFTIKPFMLNMKDDRHMRAGELVLFEAGKLTLEVM